ncbi:hypothetical protein [Aeromicrobium sp. 179-A 4D2 NHS]|uniref:hypothetical protein n=1 Tax=Aeromicrobium sp. 179-A 4D2 NHS TaxID=3142375 RepID=UPI0039A2C89B
MGEYEGEDPPWVYPIEPLAHQVTLAGGFQKAACELTQRDQGRLERAWLRGVAAGYVTWREADAIAVGVLGLHPFAVWGDGWFGTLTENR